MVLYSKLCCSLKSLCTSHLLSCKVIFCSANTIVPEGFLGFPHAVDLLYVTHVICRWVSSQNVQLNVHLRLSSSHASRITEPGFVLQNCTDRFPSQYLLAWMELCANKGSSLTLDYNCVALAALGFT